MQSIKDKVKNDLSIILVIAIVMTLIFLTILLNSYEAKSDYKNNKIKESRIQNIISSQITEFEISIPSLKIKAPIIPNVDGTNPNEYLTALTKGVAHYEGTGLPGYGRNIFIFGHSSSPDNKKGSYDKIFSTLNNLKTNNEIIIKFNNKDFVYLVESKKIISPNDLSILNQYESERLTLMACWPVGNNTERIAIIAKRK